MTALLVPPARDPAQFPNLAIHTHLADVDFLVDAGFVRNTNIG